jgi:ubiquinone/menaquinone biosynthesis C-methylase UbiE
MRETPQPGVTAWQEDRYRAVLSTSSKSPLLAQIWRDAYGDEYPEEADPFGFVTVSDLETIASALALGPGEPFADIGCGRGGPGLWVARRTQAFLTGIDIVAEAVEQAKQLRDLAGMTDNARFETGSFSDTRLAGASQRAVMSIDAFWMALDKPAALREMARILAPGGRLAMTTWTASDGDLRSMLERAGFHVLACIETPQWKERQMAVYRGILRNRAALEQEMGAPAAEVLVAEAREAPAKLAGAPRRLITAELRQ